MSKTGTTISVVDDIGVLRDALVQGPLCSPSDDVGADGRKTRQAVQQHQRLVEALETSGVTVRHLDGLLGSALGFADARDWILERRIDLRESEPGGVGAVLSWLSEQPADCLTRWLMQGLQPTLLPAELQRMIVREDGHADWLIAPLAEATRIRRLLRVMENAVVLCRSHPQKNNAVAITIATVLNFAPLFDQSSFEFWLGADGADTCYPPVSGSDLSMPGERVWVGAVTRNTSVQGLSLLAASLYRQNRDGVMFWVDLTGSGHDCLDDCFLPLSRECLLVDRTLLDQASAFVVRADHRGAVLAIEPCRFSFLVELQRSLSPANVSLVDAGQYEQPVAAALAGICPVVVAPGRIIAFDQHEAAFRALERQGIEVVASLPGDAIAERGNGPRDLVSALHAS